MVDERPIGVAPPTVNELEDEIAKLEAELAECSRENSKWELKVGEVVAENQKLRDALEYYADPYNQTTPKIAQQALGK